MTKPKKGKRFIYSLKTLLKVREIRQKKQEEVYSKAMKTYEDEIKKEQELIQLQQAMYSDLIERMSSGDISDVNQITLRKHHIEQMKDKIDEQGKVREEAEKKKDEEKEKLKECMIKKQIMEKDKEKTREAWKKLMLKEENKFLDEVSSAFILVFLS